MVYLHELTICSRQGPHSPGDIFSLPLPGSSLSATVVLTTSPCPTAIVDPTCPSGIRLSASLDTNPCLVVSHYQIQRFPLVTSTDFLLSEPSSPSRSLLSLPLKRKGSILTGKGLFWYPTSSGVLYGPKGHFRPPSRFRNRFSSSGHLYRPVILSFRSPVSLSLFFYIYLSL